MSKNENVESGAQVATPCRQSDGSAPELFDKMRERPNGSLGAGGLPVSVRQRGESPLELAVSDARTKSKKEARATKVKARKKRGKNKKGKKAPKLKGLAWVAASEAARSVEGVEGLRPLGLIVIRESDEWDLEMFNSMRELTYQNLKGIPAVEAIRAVGLKPLDGDSFQVVWENESGQTVTREVIVSRIRHGDTKALLFFFEGYWHLWSQASAAKISQFGYNNFTRILTQQIEHLSPVTLYAANLSRLIRSEREADKLIEAMRDHVDLVDARDQKFELVGKNDWVGFMMLRVLGWCASSERTAIVQRLLAGRVSQWRRNEWPLGSAVVPFGYEFDKKRKRLVPDVSKQDAVREMLIVLCSDAPPSEKARELDRIGVRPFRRDPKTGGYKPFSARTNPDQAIRTLMIWAPLWVQGEYLHRYTNPLDDLEELSGLKIVRYPRRKLKFGKKAKPKDPGELQMLFKMDTPKGGWAEEALLEAFSLKATSMSASLLASKVCNPPRPLSMTVAESSKDPDLLRRLLSAESLQRLDGKTVSRRHSARARSMIRPFLGRNWIEDDWFYELQASSQNSYRILRWPLSSMDPDVDPELRQHDGGL